MQNYPQMLIIEFIYRIKLQKFSIIFSSTLSFELKVYLNVPFLEQGCSKRLVVEMNQSDNQEPVTTREKVQKN